MINDRFLKSFFDHFWPSSGHTCKTTVYSEETYKSDAEDDGFKTCRDEAEFTQLGSLGGNSPAFLCGNSFFKSNTPVKNTNLQTPKLDAMTEEFENQNLVNNQNDDTPKRKRDTEIITDVDTAFTFLKDKVSVEMVSKTQSVDGLKNLENGDNVRNTGWVFFKCAAFSKNSDLVKKMFFSE